MSESKSGVSIESTLVAGGWHDAILFGEIMEHPPSFPHDSGGNPEWLRQAQEKARGKGEK